MATLRDNAWLALAAVGLVAGVVLALLGIVVAPMWLAWLGFALILLTLCLWPLVGVRRGRVETAEDVALNQRRGSARATGGVPGAGAGEQHSTTSPGPNDTFVGRVAGDDTGTDEVSGAEQRSRPRTGDR